MRCSLQQNRTWKEVAALRQPWHPCCSSWLVASVHFNPVTSSHPVQSRMWAYDYCHLMRSIIFDRLIRTTMSMLIIPSGGCEPSSIYTVSTVSYNGKRRYSSSLLITITSSVDCFIFGESVFCFVPKCNDWWVSFHIEDPLDDSSLIIYSFTIPVRYRQVNVEVQAHNLSIYSTWGKSARRSVEAASHILLWLFVFYWGLITSKVQFQRQPMIHLQVPLSQSLPHPLSSSIFTGAGRPWEACCWQSPRRTALPVWARRWWGWRCRCLLGCGLPPCSKSHIWKKRERDSTEVHIHQFRGRDKPPAQFQRIKTAKLSDYRLSAEHLPNF